MVSVDHSLNSLPVPSIGPITPIAPTGDINDVVEQTSVSRKSTKSVVNDYSSSVSSSTTTSTTTTSTKSTVLIEKCSDYTSSYELGPCDLYKGIQIIKTMDNIKVIINV